MDWLGRGSTPESNTLLMACRTCMAASTDSGSISATSSDFVCVDTRVEVDHHGAPGRREQHRPPPPVPLVVLARDEPEAAQAGDEPRHGGRVDGQLAR